MKNIRSKSIAALSIMLLLSTASVRTMEDIVPAESLAQQYVAAQEMNELPSAPKAGWTDSAKGIFKSAGNGIVSVASKTANGSLFIAGKAKDGVVSAGSYVAGKAHNVYAATPTFADAKSAIVDFAKEHPVYATAIAIPVVAGAGYVAYKAGKAVTNKVKAKNAERKQFADALANVNTVAQAIVDNIAAGSNKNDVKLVVKPLVEFALTLPKESAYRKAFAAFVKAAISVDVKSKNAEAQVEAFSAACGAIKELYKNNSVSAKLAKLVPTKKTAALVAGVAAIPAAYYAYQNGYATAAGESIANVTGKAFNAVKNVNYAPVTNFAKDHKVALGVTAGVPMLGGSLYLGRNKIKNLLPKKAQAKENQESKNKKA